MVYASAANNEEGSEGSAGSKRCLVWVLSKKMEDDMEKSGSQKVLKVISIIMIVLGVLGVVSGALLLAGGGALGVSGIDTANDDAAVAGGLTMIVGFGLLLSSAFNLVIGIFGLRGANNPSKIGAFFVLAVLGVVFGALNLVGTFLGGAELSSIVSAIVSLALPIACVMLANNIKHREMRW